MKLQKKTLLIRERDAQRGSNRTRRRAGPAISWPASSSRPVGGPVQVPVGGPPPGMAGASFVGLSGSGSPPGPAAARLPRPPGAGGPAALARPGGPPGPKAAGLPRPFGAGGGFSGGQGNVYGRSGTYAHGAPGPRRTATPAAMGMAAQGMLTAMGRGDTVTGCPLASMPTAIPTLAAAYYTYTYSNRLRAYRRVWVCSEE